MNIPKDRFIHKPGLDLNSFILPINKGGTGAKDPVQAAINLNLATHSQIGLANGPVPIDATGHIDPNFIPDSAKGIQVNIIGEHTMFTGETKDFFISDYDSHRVYTITPIDGGSVSRNGDIVTYTAGTVITPAGFVINGKVVPITLSQALPSKPSIIIPVNNAINLGPTLDFTSSAYNILGNIDTHATSDWQLSTDIAFTNIVLSTVNDGINLTSWSVNNPPTPSILENTDYYIRVRHTGTNGGVSPWSDPNKFTTKADFGIFLNTGLFPVTSTFPTIAFNYNGDICIVGNNHSNELVNYPARIFRKESGSWVLKRTIYKDSVVPSYGPATGSGRELGTSVAISDSGNVIAIGGSNGIIIVKYDIGTDNWINDEYLTIGVLGGIYPGCNVALNGLGDKLFYSDFYYNGGIEGTITIMSDTITGWVREYDIIPDPSDIGATTSWSSSLSVSSDGNVIFHTYQDNGNSPVYIKSGTTYILDQIISHTARSFNIPGDISRDGNTIIISDKVYRKSGGIWTEDISYKIPINTSGTAVNNNGTFILLINNPNNTFMTYDYVSSDLKTYSISNGNSIGNFCELSDNGNVLAVIEGFNGNASTFFTIYEK